jgi:3-deoxy-7-phosphoheptulonate synthase
MRQTNNLRVEATVPLLSPAALKEELPIAESSADFVAQARDEIGAVLDGRDRRLLVVVGPCSIHDVAAARDYATRLGEVRRRLGDRLLVVMRVYFEKPRTTTGWKGLINDPHLDGTHDVMHGLRLARRLLLDLAEQGVPAGTEMLDPVSPQYTAELMTWSAIGARTTESQTHREMASGLSMPVGFKNGTDGGLDVALNGMRAARTQHSFLGIDVDGRVAVVRTTGNDRCHLVLRGGSAGPNFGADHVRAAADKLAAAGLCTRVLVDCSHANSGKHHDNQPKVVADVARQVRDGSPNLLGVMIESHLVAGRQDLAPGRSLVYGQSITDACIDFAATERCLDELAATVH